MNPPSENNTRIGITLALCAYFIWGIAPIYFKFLVGVSPFSVLSHRVLWSFFFLAIIIHLKRQWPQTRQALAERRTRYRLLITSLLIASNWLIFIWAVNANHMLDASLGYFINPLLSVVLGLLFLQERLRPRQWFAVFLAAIGVLIQLLLFGSIPWVAIALACTFGFYGLMRKKLAINAQIGLFIETLLLMPVALIYLLIFAPSSVLQWTDSTMITGLFLLSAGVITTIPLLCFNGAATHLPLSTLGFFQYVGPTLMFILATVVYGEPLTDGKLITFAFIWAALAIFCLDAWYNHRKQRLVTPKAVD